MAILPFTNIISNLGSFKIDLSKKEELHEMPALFLGHGSPMNAIEDNEFTRGFKKIAEDIPRPKAIICVSAHWETNGTFITGMEKPRTIHDFSGFPKSLYEIQYPAPGFPALGENVREILTSVDARLDFNWGYDHGAWSVVKHLYPAADIPMIQLSIDQNANPEKHYEIAGQLSELRKKGILIIGSGNMVHNLGRIAWDKLGQSNYAYDWAIEANEQIKKAITENEHRTLTNFRSQGKAWDLAIPTTEHFIPLIYIMGIKNKKDQILIFNDKAVGGSLTMTSVKIG